MFRAFLDWLPTGDFWVAEARPFFEALLCAVPDRIVFGSDWPYPALDDAPPDVGRMIDLIDAWTGNETLRHKMFVDNPVAL